MKIHRTLLLLLWVTNLPAHATLVKLTDISGDALRYRQNPQAMATFGSEIADDPAMAAPARASLYFRQAKLSARAGQYLSAVRNYSGAIDMHPTAVAFDNRGVGSGDDCA